MVNKIVPTVQEDLVNRGKRKWNEKSVHCTGYRSGIDCPLFSNLLFSFLIVIDFKLAKWLSEIRPHFCLPCSWTGSTEQILPKDINRYSPVSGKYSKGDLLCLLYFFFGFSSVGLPGIQM